MSPRPHPIYTSSQGITAAPSPCLTVTSPYDNVMISAQEGAQGSLIKHRISVYGMSNFMPAFTCDDKASFLYTQFIKRENNPKHSRGYKWSFQIHKAKRERERERKILITRNWLTTLWRLSPKICSWKAGEPGETWDSRRASVSVSVWRLVETHIPGQAVRQKDFPLTPAVFFLFSSSTDCMRSATLRRMICFIQFTDSNVNLN